MKEEELRKSLQSKFENFEAKVDNSLWNDVASSTQSSPNGLVYSSILVLVAMMGALWMLEEDELITTVSSNQDAQFTISRSAEEQNSAIRMVDIELAEPVQLRTNNNTSVSADPIIVIDDPIAEEPRQQLNSIVKFGDFAADADDMKFNDSFRVRRIDHMLSANLYWAKLSLSPIDIEHIQFKKRSVSFYLGSGAHLGYMIFSPNNTDTIYFDAPDKILSLRADRIGLNLMLGAEKHLSEKWWIRGGTVFQLQPYKFELKYQSFDWEGYQSEIMSETATGNLVIGGVYGGIRRMLPRAKHQRYLSLDMAYFNLLNHKQVNQGLVNSGRHQLFLSAESGRLIDLKNNKLELGTYGGISVPFENDAALSLNHFVFGLKIGCLIGMR